MVIWFVIIKKEKFVESILIEYNVLMITNLNDLYTWVSCLNMLKIGPVFWLCYSWLIACENRLRSRLMQCLQEQGKIRSSIENNCWFPEQSKNREQGWSTAQNEKGWQLLQKIFKPPRMFPGFKNLCIFIDYFFINSCVNVKQESLNYTHSRKGFLGIGFEHYLRNRLRTVIQAVPKLKNGSY